MASPVDFFAAAGIAPLRTHRSRQAAVKSASISPSLWIYLEI
jgi:hypothetical protein